MQCDIAQLDAPRKPFHAVAEATVQVSLLSLCCITDLCILFQKESPTTSRQSPANGHSSINSSILVRTPQSSQMTAHPLPQPPTFQEISRNILFIFFFFIPPEMWFIMTVINFSMHLIQFLNIRKCLNGSLKIFLVKTYNYTQWLMKIRWSLCLVSVISVHKLVCSVLL